MVSIGEISVLVEPGGLEYVVELGAVLGEWLEEALDHPTRVRGEIGREGHRRSQDVALSLVHSVSLLYALERGAPNQKLKQE